MGAHGAAHFDLAVAKADLGTFGGIGFLDQCELRRRNPLPDPRPERRRKERRSMVGRACDGAQRRLCRKGDTDDDRFCTPCGRFLVNNMARPRSELGGLVILLHMRRQVVATAFRAQRERVQTRRRLTNGGEGPLQRLLSPTVAAPEKSSGGRNWAGGSACLSPEWLAAMGEIHTSLCVCKTVQSSFTPPTNPSSFVAPASGFCGPKAHSSMSKPLASTDTKAR